ncbi:hydantoinase B/oxoprolinase family protein [Capillimicrobium parvum]|uniref:Acetophenone carboxylase delta subunit n=1 Tax=Capillimicrobium parvum TaxID=2884022 RepID=A0A9E6Y1F1_9ACTN|nr:hydantoinase B/oxoprolinase family protein [Capillimicrobium parvum]UGS38432.1 Acetophenone carboxylase delta subunit [Capillimicrobium parvum]
MAGLIAAIESEVLRRKFEAVTRDAGVVLANLARSREIKEGRECAVALADRQGGIVATDDPLQLGLLTAAVDVALARFKFDMRSGDVVLLTDPYLGGARLHDFTLVIPHAVDEVVQTFVCVRARMPDIGGDAPGSHVPAAREIWAEGVPISPLKIHRHGRPVRDVLTSVLLNSRCDAEVRENLSAMLAAADLAARRLDELVGAHGADGVGEAMAYAQGYGERQARSRIARWADGTYASERQIWHAGAPVTVRASVSVEEGRVSVDLSGSDPQQASFLNSTMSASVNAAATALLALLGPDVPPNGGVLRCLDVRCDEGRLANPRWPAAVNGGAVHLAGEIAEVTAAALREAAGDDYGAVSAPRWLLTAHRPAVDAAPIDIAAWAIAGCAGAHGRDGWGAPHVLSRARRPSAEEWEVSTGMVVRAAELVSDSAGAGRWRGSPALELVVDVPDERAWTVSSATSSDDANGVAGGAGAAGADLRVSGGGEPEIGTVELSRRIGPCRVVARFGGGCGHGDPFLRAPADVLEDVQDGLLTAAAARRDYGVVVDAGEREVDDLGTREHRLERGAPA